MSDLINHAKHLAHLRHEGQFRKGKSKEPYVVHLEEVTTLCKKWGAQENVIAAAWLHDIVEDCPPTSLDEIATLFGNNVGSIVSELTDNKSLSKAKRKQKQIDDAPKKSNNASIVILADKTSNIISMIHSPPIYWSLNRRLEYVMWANKVVTFLPYISAEIISEFSRLCDQAELKAYYDLGTLRQAQKVSIWIMERRGKY